MKNIVATHLAREITNVPDFPKPGIQFKDITTLLEKPYMMTIITGEFTKYVSDKEYDKILCADARGFIFGAALASVMAKPLVLARKPGKLPRPGISVSYDLEYGSNTLEVSAGSINDGDRVLIIDDLLATGGSAKAMCDIVEASGGSIYRCLFLIELMPLKGRDKLPYGKTISIVKYGVCEGEKVYANLEGIAEEDQLRYDGMSELPVLKVDEHWVVCGWKLEDQVSTCVIPNHRIKSVIGIDGEERDYLE